MQNRVINGPIKIFSKFFYKKMFCINDIFSMGEVDKILFQTKHFGNKPQIPNINSGKLLYLMLN